MKWVVLVLLLLAACSGAETIENAEDTGAEEGFDEAQEEKNVEESSETDSSADGGFEEAQNDQGEAQETPESTPSLAEQYLEEFYSEVQFYSFTYEHPAYEQITVAWWPEFTKYYAQDHYWKVTFEMVEKGWTVNEEYIEQNREDLQDGSNRHIEYIWEENDEYSGCMRNEEGLKYIKENCLEDENETKIIYEGLNFDAPRLPQDWLLPFVGKEPTEVRANRNYKENAANHIVNQVYYDNGDGTETLLYVHAGHKMPLKIEILKDKKVIETTLYENIVFNKKNIWDIGEKI